MRQAPFFGHGTHAWIHDHATGERHPMATWPDVPLTASDIQELKSRCANEQTPRLAAQSTVTATSGIAVVIVNQDQWMVRSRHGRATYIAAIMCTRVDPDHRPEMDLGFDSASVSLFNSSCQRIREGSIAVLLPQSNVRKAFVSCLSARLTIQSTSVVTAPAYIRHPSRW